MTELPGYDAWKLMTPEEDEESRMPRGWRRREWEDENADYLYDRARDEEREDE